MKVLVLDVWHDLRTKRLWPVALLLAAGLVAALVFSLSRGSEQPLPPAPTAAGAAGAVDGAGVRLTEEPLGGSSKLDKFHPHNPFAPGLRRVDPEDAVTPGGAAAPVPDDGRAGAPIPDDGATSDIDAAPVGLPDTPVSGGPQPSFPASGPEAGADRGAAGKDASGRREPTRVEVRYMAYEADVAFGLAGQTRLHRGVDTLALLPNKNHPLLLFSGLTPDGETGVFSLLHPGLTAKGECVQIAGECPPVVILERGERQRIQGPDGKTYVVRLVATRRVTVDG